MAKKKKKSFKGKLGSGQRFRACVRKMRSQGAKDPEAVCASIGRKKYGKKRFAQLGKKGKRK